MPHPEILLQRLDHIGDSLGHKEGALVLLGVGSVGEELDRLDEYSDLDFFVIVKPGFKQRFIEQLDWLEEVHPLDYYFKNTDDGYKILFQDGIYGEFAIFEKNELENIPYKGGRVVWKSLEADNFAIKSSNSERIPSIRKDQLDYSLNEALTNLYVGLGRYARGEKLSAVRFIEGYAIDSILSVLHLVEKEEDYFPDCFGNERRLEKRFPKFGERLGDMMQGYNRVPESAIHILNYLESVYPVNRRLSEEIRKLAE
ncbi:hypothetical protein EJP77_01570 [Paenibacillus zeisoli]|uniref:DUF4037 domain-containing protein n=1 Tax=Paenibacillus zeisoli TaxID=2496267 RepID=A0A3S1BW94_9BACL|nr:hypothetical protein [Paenibacillus zeisoli]RUT35734.1 hypothetical protein EJP77_01570 [Paenibacillus zeisoli]